MQVLVATEYAVV